MNQTMGKLKMSGRKENEQSTMGMPQSHEELSDFETFRNLESSMSKVLKTGAIGKKKSYLSFQLTPNAEKVDNES